MACKLSPKQIEALYKVVLGEIVSAKNAGRKYNPEEHMKAIYNTILNRTKDQANALDYVQHMPTMIITAQASNEDIADFLQDSGVSIDNINKLRRDFKDVNNVINFVGAGQNLELETALELAQEQADEQKFASPDTYGSIEKQDEDLKNNFKAMPTTGYVLGNQEAQDYGGLKAEDNVVDPDPKKQAYYALTRKLNSAISESGAINADNLSIDGFKGIFIMPVKASEIPFDELYEASKEYFSKDDEPGPRSMTKEEKLRSREEGDDVYLVYTDKDGNHLYVDENGRLNKDGVGTLPYATLRRPRYVRGEWTLFGVQTIDEMLGKPGAPTRQELEAERSEQIKTLQKVREYTINNPNNPLLLSIAPGRNGYVKENFSKKNKISSVSLDQGFNPIYSPIDNGPYKKGGVYFTVKDYDFPVLIKRPTFSEIGLNTSLGELLFGDTLSNKEKIDLLQQFAYSKQTSGVVRDNKLFIKQQDQLLDTTDPANKQKFVDAIATQIVNINKDLLGSSVMVPVMNTAGTAFELQKQNYGNFLANNFYTNLELNAENKIVKLNAYNTFQINKDSQEKLYPSKPVEEKVKPADLTQSSPTDQSIEQLKEKLKGLGGLKKSVLLDSTATDEQIATAKSWYENSPLNNFIKFQALFNIVNSNARAEFTLAGITLFNGANYTDLYHEGWHVFSQMFLTKEQKKSLYNETRKLAGSFKTVDGRTVKFKDALDIQLEEFLAEDFRKYVLSDGTKIINNRSTRNNIFSKIYNFLKALFTGQSLQSYLADQEAIGKVKELYDKLLIGNINEYSPSLFNVQFSILNKGMQVLEAKPDEINGLTYQESMILNESVDSLMSGIISEIGQGVGVIITNPEIMGYVYAAVKTRLEQLREKTTNPDAQRILDFGIQNFGEYSKVVSNEQVNGVIAFHRLRSSYLTFEDKFADATLDEKADIEGQLEPVADEENMLGRTDAQLQEDFGTTAFERKGNENSILAIASSETVYMVKSLPLLDKKGNPILNMLGTPKQVDFNKTWGILINAVAGSIDKSDMHAKLLKASQTFPELKALVQDVTIDGTVQTARLPRPTEKVSNETDSIYYRMWTAFFRDFSVYRIPIKEVQVIKEVTSTVDQKGKEKLVGTGKFQVRFVESEPLFQQVQNNFNNAFQSSPAGRYIKMGASGVNELNLDNVIADFPKSTLFQGDNYFKFLRAIGFYMTDNPLVKENLLKMRRSIDFIYSAVSKMQKDKATVTNPLAALEAESGNRKKILNVEGAYSTKYNNNAISNVKGDSEYDLSLNTGVTQVAKELNDPRKATYDEVVKQPHMAHLDVTRSPFAKYGVILGSLFELPVTWREVDLSNRGYRRKVNGENVTLQVENLNGIKNIFEDVTSGLQSNQGGIKTLSLDPNSKMLMDLHMLLEAGVMELTRRGSKSSAFGVHVSNINTEFNDNDKALYISTGYFADPVKARNAQVTLLKAKLAAEMERIAIVKSDLEFNNIINFTDRAKSFQMFDDILSNELKAELIEAADPNDSYSVVNSAKFSERISNGISNYMENLYQENKAMFDEMSFLSEQMKTKIRRIAEKDTGKKNLKSDELAEIALRSFTFNALFHNMEIVSLLDGDYATFNHDKEEYSKRSSYITSTGRIFSTDVSDYAFLNNLGNAYGQKIGAPKKEFNGILNSVVFRDVELQSKYFDVYVDALVKSGMSKQEAEKTLKPYTEMKEGDAQGWLTFDTYRALSLLQNEWSPKQNDLYNKIIKGQKVDPQDIAQYFPPRKFQYSGPVQTSKLHIPAFHKFSLAPLIPSVIEGTELETLHDNLVRQGVDYALFESGSKLATLTNDGRADQFYEGDNYDQRTIKAWKQGDPEYKKNPIFLQYLKSQVDINDEWKNKTIFSTQLRVLIINNLYKNGVPLNDDFGKLVTDLEKLLDTLQEYKKQDLLKEIGWVTNQKGEPTGDLTKLVAFVKKELTRQDLADHDIAFVDLNEAGTALRNDLSFSLNAEKIEKLLNAIVIKRLVRQKVNGEQLIQVSGAGFESRSKFRKASEEDMLKYKGTNDLPTYMPGAGKNGATTAMKVKIAMKGDYYKLLELNSVKDYAKKNNISALDALNTLLKDDKWLDTDDNRKLITMVGVRIPVQGFNSMEFMEVYEFLPEEAGNILIPPAEIVAKAGSDFDIDKLTIFQPNYSSSKKFASYSKSSSAKGTENKIIESIREILEHPKNFVDLIRPNDVDLVKGTATDLAKENIQGYNPLANKVRKDSRKNKKGENVISPTRGLEPRYNYYKHESNNVGKITLGIGAVDNKYSAIMKRIGLYLNPQYTFKTATGKDHPRRTHIAMDHNSIKIDGQPVISLSDIDTQTKQKVSDLIAQLMNGWVDVEKDAWIFNLNGNSIGGPALLFLLEAGVDFKTAAYFISQPLVVDYIKERYRSDSPFYDASGQGINQGRGLNKFNIRRELVDTYVEKLKTFQQKETGDIIKKFSAEDLYGFIKNNVPTSRKFTEKELLDNIKSKNKNSEISKQTLLHFFEIEDMMAQLTNIKLTMNVDTAPSKSFTDAYARKVKINALNDTDIVDQSMFEKIKKNTPVSSFFVQDFQVNLFKPMMQVRADEAINNYLIEKIKNREYESMFPDVESFVSAFKNDIGLYILQNSIKGFDISKLKEYNSLVTSKTLPVEAVQLKYGAFVKDGVMYVDANQIRQDYDSKAFSKDTFKKRGLHVLAPETFNTPGNTESGFQEYARFVLEREYLRSMLPVNKGESRESYEKRIAERALETTFNFYTILKSKDNFAVKFQQIAKDNEDLPKEYLIFDQVTATPGQKGMKTLKLKSSKLDRDTKNVLHENLIRLSDPNTVKDVEVSKFFRRLILGEFLRAGITKTSDSLAPILPTDTISKLLEKPVKDLTESGTLTSKAFLDGYFEMFKSNWSLSKKSTRNKFRNYLKPAGLNYTKAEPKVEKPTQAAVSATTEGTETTDVRASKTGALVFTAPVSQTAAVKLLEQNPSVMFVYPTNSKNVSEPVAKKYKDAGNSLPIPVKEAGGTNSWSDNTYDENIKLINEALNAIQDQMDSGSVVAFPEEGLTTFDTAQGPKDIMRSQAPRTFEYLATELYKRFKYVHPEAEKTLGFRKEFQAGQPITDEEVDEFMKKCFGE